jgi:hypothetical protein
MTLYAEATITVSFPLKEDDVEDAGFYLADILRDYSLMLQDEMVQPRGQLVEVLNGRVVAAQRISSRV